MRKMNFRFVLLVAVVLILSCCSDQMSPASSYEYILRLTKRMSVQMPPNPYEGRQNPLMGHIRTQWTDGDSSSTGGLHYPHIKVFGICWKDIGNAGWDPTGEQAQFIAEHFDMYAWGGYGIADRAYPTYPSFIWLETSGSNHITSAWDSAQTMQWISSMNNESSVTWDELVMHYKFDGHNIWDGYRSLWGAPPDSMFRGWNPDDDSDSDGCIGQNEGSNGQPSDSTRTAICIQNAEIIDFAGASGRQWWTWAELSPSKAPGYAGNIDMRSDLMAAKYGAYGKKYNGCLLDNAAFNDMNYGLEKSFTYEGSNYHESNSQYYVNRVAWITAFAAALDSKISLPLIVYLGNVVSPYYTCTPGNGKEWFQAYLENCWDECWLESGDGDVITIDEIECRLNCPYLQYCEQGKGYVFSAKSHNNSYRERRFLLATFYMLNHQMAFFYYRVHNALWYDDHTPISSADKVWDWQWNSYIPYDVGQPVMNSFGKPDFQGNMNTNRYFVFYGQPSYKILGREFMRVNGQRILVLTKIMASGQIEGQNPTTHILPKCYRQVQSNLSLSEISNQITLCNNDAAILVETTCPRNGGDPEPDPVEP